MNYAKHLQATYYANKERIGAGRKAAGLSYILTLEDRLNDGYMAYKKFCIEVGSTPKTFSEFLRMKVI